MSYASTQASTAATASSTTTTKFTALPVITSPNTHNAGPECNIVIPDYTVLRQENLTKINTYYNKLLSSYTQFYKDYSTQVASSNVNDRTYANTTIKPKVQNNNTQIINLSKEMIKNVNQDTELIIQQKDDLKSKSNEIDTLMNNIKLLKEKNNDMSILAKSREDSMKSTKSGADDMNFSTYVYIGLNMLMVLIIIGIVIYIVYSKYESGNNKNNNIHRNIMPAI